MTLIDTEQTTLPTPPPITDESLGEASVLVAELSVDRPNRPESGRTPEDEAVAWWRRVLNRVDRLNAGRPDGEDIISLRVEGLRSSTAGATRSARITLELELPGWIAPESVAQQLRPIAPPTSLLRTARPTELWAIPV